MRLSHSAPNAKAGDSYKRQQEAWRRAYAETLSLRERFPQVEQLAVHMTFTDAQGVERCSAQMRSLSASAKAFLAIPCPRTLCLDGGFDLDAIVRDMFGQGASVFTGTLQCRGWLDPRRADHARCLLQMHYRIEVLYVAPQPGAARRRVPV
jgi:hypothetical protein